LALVRQFSTPGGIPSHVSVLPPGSIHEGGELGYALVHAFGAAFDNPDVLVACFVGDGEADTAPLEGSWKGIRFLDPEHGGAVSSASAAATHNSSASGCLNWPSRLRQARGPLSRRIAFGPTCNRRRAASRSSSPPTCVRSSASSRETSSSGSGAATPAGSVLAVAAGSCTAEVS